jgi:phage baseplate assembly protein W
MANSDGLGTGWGFPPQFYNKGQVVRMATGEDDVKESLEILFSTAIQERLYYPNYGCDMKKFMFEEVNYNLVIELQQMILNAVYKYEPRIEVQKIEVTESEENGHVLIINMEYLIKEQPRLESIVYPVSLG